jgi:hypothetical protein
VHALAGDKIEGVASLRTIDGDYQNVTTLLLKDARFGGRVVGHDINLE